MTIKSINEKPHSEIEIDLTGPDGNAYALMAYARSWSKQLGYNAERILEDMQSSDYDHLIAVMEKNFGDIVTFYK